MSADIERLIERVWTLAGCVAALREAARNPITLEDLLTELIGEACLRRSDLYRWRDDLPSVAARLETLHRELSREIASWRPAVLVERVHEAHDRRLVPEAPPAARGARGDGARLGALDGLRVELDLDKLRALGIGGKP